MDDPTVDFDGFFFLELILTVFGLVVLELFAHRRLLIRFLSL